MINSRHILVLASVITLVACHPPEAETRPQGIPVLGPKVEKAALREVSYIKHVQPVLRERCYHCHSATVASGGWNMEDVSQFYTKGSKGKRVVPFHPEQSLMTQFISGGNHRNTMPAVGNSPTENEIVILKYWIKAGAKTNN